MTVYHIKAGSLSSKKWKFSPRFRSKYLRRSASLFRRKYLTLRKELNTSLVVVKSDASGDPWLPDTNTSIEEKKLLFEKIPKSYFKETFQIRLSNIKFSVFKHYDKKSRLLSRMMPKATIKEALYTLNKNISMYMSKHYDLERELFSHTQPKSAIAEAFRILRTNLSFASFKRSNKVIMITSPGTEEGKSTVTINLGVVMAQAHSRVLIVDCDLRKPVMHDYFLLDKFSGLTNMLVQDLEPEDVIKETDVERLFVIPSGPIPPNPSELLGSAKMAEFLAKVANKFDIVLLDTPPVIAVTDAVLLTPMADSVILVLKSGQTRIEMAKIAKERLKNAARKSISIVLNGTISYDRAYKNYYYYDSQNKI
jgi:capsular exopolysaccharide synthesis family protein